MSGEPVSLSLENQLTSIGYSKSEMVSSAGHPVAGLLPRLDSEPSLSFLQAASFTFTLRFEYTLWRQCRLHQEFQRTVLAFDKV